MSTSDWAGILGEIVIWEAKLGEMRIIKRYSNKLQVTGSEIRVSYYTSSSA